MLVNHFKGVNNEIFVAEGCYSTHGANYGYVISNQNVHTYYHTVPQRLQRYISFEALVCEFIHS